MGKENRNPPKSGPRETNNLIGQLLEAQKTTNDLLSELLASAQPKVTKQTAITPAAPAGKK